MKGPPTQKKSENWPVSWEENRRQQLLANLNLTPAQRLAWLEEALQFALKTGALQRLREEEMRRVREMWDSGSPS